MDTSTEIKHSRRKIWMFISIFIVCLVFIIGWIVSNFWFPYEEKQLRLRPWPHSVNAICCILDDYSGLEDSEQRQFVSTLKTNCDSLSINKTLVAFLRASTNNLRSLNDFDLSNGVFHDSWGTPLQFALTNNATNMGLAPLVAYNNSRDNPRPFVVWSAGPNRTNEFGSGDDVVVTGR
jgi:hypothetical protein